jgi:hypothetical protein
MQHQGMSANRCLAELLGWKDIFDVGGALLGTPPPGVPACRNQAKVPDWTGDWRACGPLLAEQVEHLSIGEPWITVGAIDELHLMWPRETGESKGGAIRRAIVSAVTMKLLERQR